MRSLSRRLAALAGVLLVACTQPRAEPPDTSEADAATIRANVEAWIAAFNAADVATLSESYTDDTIEMAPDELNRGREAITQSLAASFARETATQTATVTEVSVFGDLAVVYGTWEVKATPKDGGAEQTRAGKWMEVHRRQPDGAWKVWRWMWNQERSPAAEG